MRQLEVIVQHCGVEVAREKRWKSIYARSSIFSAAPPRHAPSKCNTTTLFKMMHFYRLSFTRALHLNHEGIFKSQSLFERACSLFLFGFWCCQCANYTYAGFVPWPLGLPPYWANDGFGCDGTIWFGTRGKWAFCARGAESAWLQIPPSWSVLEENASRFRNRSSAS